MSFTYQPLWDMLEDKGISKMEFARKIDISSTTLAKLSKNEPITLSTIDKICNEFGCRIEDIVRHIQNAEADCLLSKDLLNVGTIIMLDSAKTTGEYRFSRFAIIDIDTSRADLVCMYIAPLVQHSSSPFCLYIKFRDDDGIEKRMSIDLSQTRGIALGPKAYVKIIYQLSSQTTNTITEYFSTVTKILNFANSEFCKHGK